MRIFATKSMDLLVNEAKESGEHSLRRTLGPFQLTALGVGAIIGAGIFVLTGLGAHYAGPGLMLSFVLSGLGCAFAGLCYAEFAAMIPLAGSAYTYAYATLGELFAWIIGWDLTLEYAMGASTVSSGWSNHFIELLDIFHIKMPLWLAYDHWTGLRTAQNIIAREMAQASDPSLVPGTQAFINRVADIISSQPPELVQRARELLDAPHIFGMDIGFNLPAFIIALLITAMLVIGNQGKRPFQRHHRGHQGGRGPVRDRRRRSATSTPPTGEPTGVRSRPTASPASGPERPTYSLPISGSTPSPPPRRRPRIRSATCPSESSPRCWCAPSCTSWLPACSPAWCRGGKSTWKPPSRAPSSTAA